MYLPLSGPPLEITTKGFLNVTKNLPKTTGPLTVALGDPERLVCDPPSQGPPALGDPERGGRRNPIEIQTFDTLRNLTLIHLTLTNLTLNNDGE